MNDVGHWFVRGARALKGEWIDPKRLRDEGRVERWGHRAPIHHRRDVDELYIVLKGGVETSPGDPVRLTSGDLFGLIEADVEPRFRAYDETTLVAVERSHFDELVDKNGLIRTTRVRDKIRRVPLTIELAFEELIGVEPVGRMARALERLASEHGVGEDRVTLPALKPRHYGELAALDRRSAQRAFNALVDASLVETSGGELIIPSITQLRKRSEERR